MLRVITLTFVVCLLNGCATSEGPTKFDMQSYCIDRQKREQEIAEFCNGPGNFGGEKLVRVPVRKEKQCTRYSEMWERIGPGHCLRRR